MERPGESVLAFPPPGEKPGSFGLIPELGGLFLTSQDIVRANFKPP